jgi:hypothetical protein
MLLPLGGKLEDQPVRAAKATRQTRLPYLAEPSLDVFPADEGGGKRQERLVRFGPALVTDGEATKSAELGERSFDNLPVLAQALTAIHPASGSASFDPAPTQGFAAA